jgi:type IV fimbrial biogenesis protein FimT
MPTRNSGFNLVEIMISLAIIGVMMALAAPNLRDFMRNASISALTNDIMADLQMARTELSGQTGVRSGLHYSSLNP